MRNVAQFAGCIIRWGGGGGAVLGILLYILYLSVAMVSDILRTGGWPYNELLGGYIFIGLLTSAFTGFVLGILAALINGAAMSMLVVAYRLRRKSANIPRNTLGLTFATASGLWVLAVCLTSESGFLWVNSSPVVTWFLGRIVPTMIAALWAWRVSSKVPVIAQQI
jgi:hypothetical protein